MTGPRKLISAGTQLNFLGAYDGSGLLAGAATTLAQGANGSGITQLTGIKRASPGPVEPQDVDITGDDDVLGSIEFGPNETPSYIVEIAVQNLDLQATLQSTAVEQFGDILLGVLQPIAAEYIDVMIIHQGKSKKQDVGVKGLKAWSGVIVPIASAIPLGRAEFGERAAAVDRYKVNTQVATKKPWNVTIADGDLGTTGAPLLPFTSDNPIHMQVFEGDGAETSFGPLDFTPVSQAKVNIIEGNGQVLTEVVDFTVVTATKLITRVAGALAAGTRWYVTYEFQP